MPVDLSFLQPLYAHEGPYASVVLDTDRAPEDARHAIGLRWRELRADLVSAGADEPTVRALDDVIGTRSGTEDERAQLAVAAAGQVLLDERIGLRPAQGFGRWDGLPHVMPLLRDLAGRLPCLVVRLDSTGADIESRGVPRGATDVVEGEDHPVHKTRGGALSHRRIQQRVDETVKHNAKLVAERVDDLVRQTGVELVVVAGDPGASSELHGQLSPHTRERIVELETSGRHADGHDVDPLVADVVARRATEQADALLATYREETGQHRRGASGLRATLDHLRPAQVDTVLVEDEDAHEPADIAALVREAATTGARMAFVEPGTLGHRDGVGAVLRYVNEPAAAHA